MLAWLGLVACDGEHSNTNTNTNTNTIDYSNLQPPSGTETYSDNIIRCVSITDVSDSCSLNELPPIGLNYIKPSIDDVMDRVVVSHSWMKQRMRDLLIIMPAEMLLLLRATTAIVIHQEIRPAHYRLETGAIYIDPAYLWLTNEEKATINQQPDPRVGNGSELQFREIGRLVINNHYAGKNYPLTGNEERNLEDILVWASALFYHELAHANDCMPSSEHANLDLANSFQQNIDDITNRGQCIHQRLVEQFPLTSTMWQGLAKVLYQGEVSSAEQRNYTPTDVGIEFAADISTATYGFTNEWEDTAMAFDSLMLKYRFDADGDVLIVPNFDLLSDDITCEQLVIKWGQRGRLGEPNVLARSQLVIAAMLPELDLAEFYAAHLSPYK
ncbi:MAG: hypothetical protein MJK12_06010 [Colwellia sp.]|nr:hypothetical protein [Colwellia sp.]